MLPGMTHGHPQKIAPGLAERAAPLAGQFQATRALIEALTKPLSDADADPQSFLCEALFPFTTFDPGFR